MSTVNNITLLRGSKDFYSSDQRISQQSLELMLARDYMDNSDVEVRKYIRIFIAQLELNREG